MTGRMWRQVVLPAVLLMVVGFLLVARPDSDPKGVAGLAPVRPPRQEPLTKDTSVADVRLELLTRGYGNVSSSERNPFRFAQRVLPAPVRRAPPPQNVPAVFQGPPPPPPIPLRFIGVIEAPQRAGGRVAIFSDGRGAVMHGKEGDIIEGRYRVLRMGSDSVELAYADGRGRQTIRLSGQ